MMKGKMDIQGGKWMMVGFDANMKILWKSWEIRGETREGLKKKLP